MGDIVTIFAKVGKLYLDEEKKVKNKAYEYKKIKTYLCDIETKTIEPYLNISKDELIITRFGVGANSGNLFPIVPLEPKEINKDFDKFIRGILKAIKNLLSFFTKEEIEQEEILKKLSEIDENWFRDIKEEILSLEKLQKEKGIKGKVATYFALGFKGKPISFYFKEVFEKHLNRSDETKLKGYDIITNKEGVGADANLAFCSVNELPKKMQSIKYRLLPLSSQSAKKIKIGFDVMDKRLSHNFYGLKLAILPTLLREDEELYKEILKIIESVTKGDIKEIKDAEEYIMDEILEEVAKKEEGYPVLNTILFYNKNNAAVDLLLQIDDVLPSFITHLAKVMSHLNIKAFRDEKANEETIFLQNLFEDRLEIMNLLLSPKKLDIDTFIEKLSTLLYFGNVNKKYASRLDWGKYFNGYYPNRSIDAMSRYFTLFKELKKLNKELEFRKEFKLESDSKKNLVEKLLQENEFLRNETLKSAYLLGMLAAAISNWQYGINGGDSFIRWLNNFGAISKERLDRLWQKEEQMIRKLSSLSGSGNRTINAIKEVLVEHLPKAFLEDEVIKSSYVSLAFAMGGNDFNKFLKES